MRLLINSLPKSGTNMVQKCMQLASVQYSERSIAASSNFGRFALIKKINRNPKLNEVPVNIGLEVPVVVSPVWLSNYINSANGYLSGHAAYSQHLSYILKKNSVSTIVCVRNPAAVLVSWAGYISEKGYYWKEAHQHFSSQCLERRVAEMLYGTKLGIKNTFYTSFNEILDKISCWSKEPGVVIIRYEDLVGPEGGGSKDSQLESIKKILDAIPSNNFKCEKDEVVESIASDLYGGTHTFRGGNIDGWRKKIDNNLAEEIERVVCNSNFSRIFGY